jgi:hypothetical protein
MHFHVPRATAQSIRMVPRNTPPDAAFVKLPDFIRVVGTLGSPKPELDKGALGRAAIQKAVDQTLGEKTKAAVPNPLNLLKTTPKP